MSCRSAEVSLRLLVHVIGRPLVRFDGLSTSYIFVLQRRHKLMLVMRGQTATRQKPEHNVEVGQDDVRRLVGQVLSVGPDRLGRLDPVEVMLRRRILDIDNARTVLLHYVAPSTRRAATATAPPPAAAAPAAGAPASLCAGSRLEPCKIILVV